MLTDDGWTTDACLYYMLTYELAILIFKKTDIQEKESVMTGSEWIEYKNPS